MEQTFLDGLFNLIAERTGQPDHQQYRQFQERGRLGLRSRGVFAWATLLHHLHRAGERGLTGRRSQ